MNPDDPSAWARLAEEDWHLARFKVFVFMLGKAPKST